MYQIQLMMAEGENDGVAGMVLNAPFIPREGEIINIYDGDKALKLFVKQISYSYKSGGIQRGIALSSIQALVSDEPPRN